MKSCILLLAAALCFAVVAQGSVVTYVGAEIDGTAADWRTSDVAKPFDLDGDNIYGSDGAVHWTKIATEQGTFWNYISSGSQYSNPPYPDIDDLAADDGTDSDASIALSSFSFSILENWGTVRVGVMHDLLSEAEYAADFGWSVTMTQTDGANVGDAVTSEILPGGNGIVDMVFFDLTGVQAGDTFALTGNYNDGRGQNAYIGPVSWDAVPEPATMALLGLGGLFLRKKSRS